MDDPHWSIVLNVHLTLLICLAWLIFGQGLIIGIVVKHEDPTEELSHLLMEDELPTPLRLIKPHGLCTQCYENETRCL